MDGTTQTDRFARSCGLKMMRVGHKKILHEKKSLAIEPVQ